RARGDLVLRSRSTPNHSLPHAFPTRCSSDLAVRRQRREQERLLLAVVLVFGELPQEPRDRRDRVGGEAHSGVDLVGQATQLGERSEEHTSELQSRENLVCRLLLEKKNTKAAL